MDFFSARPVYFEKSKLRKTAICLPAQLHMLKYPLCLLSFYKIIEGEPELSPMVLLLSRSALLDQEEFLHFAPVPCLNADEICPVGQIGARGGDHVEIKGI